MFDESVQGPAFSLRLTPFHPARKCEPGAAVTYAGNIGTPTTVKGSGKLRGRCGREFFAEDDRAGAVDFGDIKLERNVAGGDSYVPFRVGVRESGETLFVTALDGIT